VPGASGPPRWRSPSSSSSSISLSSSSSLPRLSLPPFLPPLPLSLPFRPDATACATRGRAPSVGASTLVGPEGPPTFPPPQRLLLPGSICFAPP
jgi:hypothetical protein